MLFEIKCLSCGKDQIIMDESENGERIFICKNPDCPDFNCFFTWNDAKFELVKGHSGELEFETEDGSYYEIYRDGKMFLSEKRDW
jgi:hypothetical protein